MNDLITAALLLIGSTFMLLAGVGVVRMPDLFMRTQASTKAATLGVGCMLLAVAVHFGELAIVTRCVLVTAFVVLTAPVSAHMIARAAYSVGTPLWPGSIVDELRGEHAQSSIAQPTPPPPASPASELPASEPPASAKSSGAMDA
jgi:multicomponent Na+:H+ antiporter subunit G